MRQRRRRATPAKRNARRDFLKMASVPAVGGLPLSAPLARASIAPLHTRHDRSSIAFYLGQEPAWVIDTRRFAGAPHLKVYRGRGRIEFELCEARFPGTDITADLACVLVERRGEWHMQLRLALAATRIDVSFESWLAGHTLPNVESCMECRVTDIGGAYTGRFRSGPVNVRFTPDWKIKLGCPQQFELSRAGSSQRSASITIGLKEPGSTSPEAGAIAHTSVLLEQCSGTSTMDEWLPPSMPGRLRSKGNAFETVSLEVGESGNGARYSSLQALPPEGSLQFEPGDLWRTDKGPLYLGLSDVVFTQTRGLGDRDGETLSACFDGEIPRLCCGGVSLELSNPSTEEPPLQAVFRNGRLTTYRCQPILRSIHAPLPDAIVASAAPIKPTRLAFSGDNAVALVSDPGNTAQQPGLRLAQTDQQQIQLRTVPLKTKPITGKRDTTKGDESQVQLKVNPELLRPGSVVLPDFLISVIRPEDFLVLSFRFHNLTVSTGGPPRLVRRTAGKPAHIAVQFPPQNIQEEALFETDSGGDPAKPPPVQSRLAGASRLVFRVPNSVAEIPYTLADLLRVCGAFAMRVPPTALPPPPRRQLPQFTLPADVSMRRKERARLLSSKESQLQLKQDSSGASVSERITSITKTGLVPKGPVTGTPPSPLETVVEMPYRLWLAPHADSAWAHAGLPRTGHRNRVELWHTRLGVRRRDGGVDEDNDYYRTLRAVWSPDYNRKSMPPAGGGDFLASLDARDRHEIVALTSDFRIPDYTPLPVWTKRFMLSSLGAWLDSRGQWSPPCDPVAGNAPTGVQKSAVAARALTRSDPCPPGTSAPCPGVALSVEEWRHRATMGRDHYVRVVYKGYLFPFGHRASLIKVTERKFRAVESGPLKGKLAAYLHQRMFIVVRQPLLDYPISEPEDRRNPFRAIQITTDVTPNLDKPELSDIANGNRRAFWPFVNGEPFLFHLIAEDWRGKTSDFTAPLIFLDQGWAKDPQEVSKAVNEYVKAAPIDRRKRGWQSQSVAYAEVQGKDTEATALDTLSVTFGARTLGCLQGDRPAFLPEVEQARTRIPAVEALSGGQPSTIRISPIYVAHGFDGKNAGGEVFIEVVGGSPLGFSADRSGGVATPNMNIAALSRRNGPVGGRTDEEGEGPGQWLEEFANGVFDPQKYFEGALTDAMLLGGIQLFDLLIGKDENNPAKLSSDDAPKLTNTPIFENDELTGVETRLIWEPPVNPKVPVFIADKGGQTQFKLEARIVNRISGGEPEQYIHGVLTNFSIDLLGGAASFLEIEFSRFEFTSVSGSKPDIDPQIRDVAFKGPLKYVQELSDTLGNISGGDQGGAGGGFNIDVTPGGINADFGLSIPTVNTGVMSLQNIAFSGGITVPFSGDPMRARFAFCGKDNPFLLTIYCFGGGGYASVGIGLDGVEQLEFAFEFGASISLDIGVASGGVEVIAGIYINMEKDDGCQLTGYLRMAGELNVLAIIRLSIEFNMALTHDTGTNKTWGECRLTVEIEILVFSVSVSMYVKREFSDPTQLPFRDMMSEQDWTRYCDSFA